MADAFALGPHWLYDTDQIATSFPSINGLTQPLAPYHEGKQRGDFTHYSDQTLLLLEHVVTSHKLDIEKFKDSWLDFVQTHKLYLDHATKESIDLLSDSNIIEGSSSNELGGLVRSSALYYLDYVTLDDVLAQTRLTHTDSNLGDIADFTYRWLKHILSGKTPSEALDLVYPTSSDYIRSKVDLGVRRLDDDSVKTIKSIGQSCSSDYGFPSALHLIFKYEDNYEEALKQNIYAGGDSAARGMYIGMILGAYLGYKQLPNQWLNEMNALAHIDELMT